MNYKIHFLDNYHLKFKLLISKLLNYEISHIFCTFVIVLI